MARVRKSSERTERHVWKVALYIRLSREDGNDESLSVTNQRKILLEYVQEHFTEEYSIVDIYVDDGNTGTDTHREGFRRMEADIKARKVNCVVVKALSRAFRNIGDQSKFLDEFLPLYRVRFISLGSPYVDTYKNPGSGTGFEVPMYGMFNEQYAAATSEEVRKTFRSKCKKGEFIGSFAPYGYLKSAEDKGSFVVDEEAALVVKDIFTWFLYGIEKPGEGQSSLSINGIARELNERNIPCPSKYKRLKGMNYCNPHLVNKEAYWAATTVRDILKNQVYTGCMVQGRRRVVSYKIHKVVDNPEEEWYIVENRHEAIISHEMFERVQDMLQRDTRTAPGKMQVSQFAGLLQCPDCGRSLHRKNAFHGVYYYYYCRTPQSAKQSCERRSIREDILEKAVLEAIQKQISLVRDLEKVIDKINKAPQAGGSSNRLEKLLKQQENELERTTQVCDSLYFDWKSGDITREEYLRMKADYVKRSEDIQRAIDKIRKDMGVVANGITSENPYFQEFQKYKNIKTLKRDLLVGLIDKIYLHKNREVTIKFRFADQYQHIADFIEGNES